MKSHFLQSFIFAFAIILASSCTKENPQPPFSPPSEASLVIDFSQFPDADGKMEQTNGGVNVVVAATSFSIWQTLLAVGLAVPVHAFKEVSQQTPTYNSETDSWEWSLSFNLANIVHAARLEGKLEGNHINWSMYISKAGHFNNFLWFYGTSLANETGGEWHLMENPNNPSPILNIAWQKSNNEFDIQYYNAVPNSSENGSYIKYGVDNSNGDYNAYYDIWLATNNNAANIEFNTAQKSGRIKMPSYFNDSNWHCWDSSLNDIVCD